MIPQFINICHRPSSELTASTLESMVDKNIQLGCAYFATADVGNMMSTLKGYSYTTKKGIKFIPGVEIFFKDNNCDIIKNTNSEQIKYFKLLIYMKDQAAYQAVIKMISDIHGDQNTITLNEIKYRLFNWDDLVNLSQYNIIACTGDIENLVSKHLLVNCKENSIKYLNRLMQIFNDKLWCSIIPSCYDEYWDQVVSITVGNKDIKTSIEVPADTLIETNICKIPAKDLVRKFSKHTQINYVYINGIKHPIQSQYRDLIHAEIINNFQKLPNDLQLQSNKLILFLMREHLDKVVINCDAYYTDKEDSVVQAMRLGEDNCISRQQHIMTSEEVINYFVSSMNMPISLTNKFINNSFIFASLFDNFKLEMTYHLPITSNPNNRLIEIIKDNGRMKWDNPIYMKQFREEYELLVNNGCLNLIPYFLPIVDICKFYKDSGFLNGPSRGSAAGFLISYLLGITHVDPIKYKLQSSRFLTIDRIQQNNLPDIDVDFCDRTPLVGEDGNGGYLYETYGDKSAQISTRSLLRIKSAILDVNRFVNGGTVDFDIIQLSKSLPVTPQGISDHDFVFGYEDSDGNRTPGLLEVNIDLQKYTIERPNEWEIVKRSLSVVRQAGRHASSFVIADQPIHNIVPVCEIGGVKRVTQPEHKQCEEMGLIKFDFLVVSALKDIRLCINYINKANGQLIDRLQTGEFYHKEVQTYIWDLPEDREVFDMLGRGETETIFQLNTTTVTPYVQQIQPQSIIDCATITALVRPGPLEFVDPDSGFNMVQEYLRRRNGLSQGRIAILNQLLPETYGIIVFQEQVTLIAQELGGMSVIDAENVRIAMGKKKIKLLDSLKPKFIEGAVKKVDLNTAEMIWDMMSKFAHYGFNKSHAVGYSIISYACAFLKYYYPLEWWAAVLSNATDKEINEKLIKYVSKILLPPDINISNEHLAIDYNNKTIRNKLSIITGLGDKCVNNIVQHRPYKDIQDFVDKKVCNPSLTKKLIHVGVLDSLFPSTTPQLDVMGKMKMYEDAVIMNVRTTKIAEYDAQLSDAVTNKDDKAIKRITTSKEKYLSSPIPESVIDDTYIGLSPQKDVLIKKTVFPSMIVDLDQLLIKYSNTYRINSTVCSFITNNFGKEVRVVDNRFLQKIDEGMFGQDVYICTPGFVVNMSEFRYANGTKKALKMIIDSSGYISEKVLWPDYNTNILRYPKNLTKGCIAYFFYKKRSGKGDLCSVIDAIVEEDSIK